MYHCPVEEAGFAATSSGVPVGPLVPPPTPPSGPKSMIWSAVLITSKLCSITSTVLPSSTKRQDFDQARNVFGMESGRCPTRYEGLSCRAVQFRSQLHSLRFPTWVMAAGRPSVTAQAHILDGLEFAFTFWNVLKNSTALLDCLYLALLQYFFPCSGLRGSHYCNDVHGRPHKEQDIRALAHWSWWSHLLSRLHNARPFDIETKGTFYSPEFWVYWSEQRDRDRHTEDACIGRWIERESGQSLINVDQGIDMLNPLNRLVFPGFLNCGWALSDGFFKMPLITSIFQNRKLQWLR